MVSKRRSILVVSLLMAVVLLSGPFLFVQPVGASDPPIHIHLTWQHETNTTMTVTWQTSANTSGDVVLYDTVPRGGVPGLYSYSATGTNHTYSDIYGPASGYIHDVELTGLTPNTTYYFICGGYTGGWSPERAFRTAPSTPSYTRFVVGGDSQDVFSPYTAPMIELMATYNPSFMINLGDHVANGEKQSEWDEYFSMLHQYLVGDNNLTIPIIPVFGNHDPGWLAKNSTKYFEQFALPQGGNEQWFSYDWGPDIHIIVLGSEDKKYPNSSVVQRDWLESDLINHSSSKFKIVLFHRPPLVASDHDEPYTPAITHWLPLFDKYHVDLVLNGHDHCYMRSKPVNWTASNTTAQNSYGQGTMYLVTGGLGPWPHEPNRHWYTSHLRKGDVDIMGRSTNFVLVDIYENNTLHLQAKNLYGVTFDEAWIVKDYSGPMASFSHRHDYPFVEDTVTFDAASSVSGNGTSFVPIVNYTWDFGDGNITTTSNSIIAHKYSLVSNTYTVTLNITDSQGLWNTTSKTITMHDMAILSVTLDSSKHGPSGSPYTPVTECYFTWTVEISVTVQNQGNLSGSFIIEAFYGNATGNYTIGTKSAGVYPGESISQIFTWDVPDIPFAHPYPTYTIYVNMSIVAGETDIADNFMVDGSVTVKWYGDGNGDGKIGLPDLMILAMSYVPGTPDAPNYNPQADYSGDGPIGLPDLMILAMNYNNGPLDP